MHERRSGLLRKPHGFRRGGRLRGLAPCCLLCCALALNAGTAAAAQGVGQVSPEVARLVLQWLEEAERNPDRSLERLEGLAARVMRSEADFAFVTAERASLLIARDRVEEARAELARALEGRPPDFAPRVRNLYGTTLLAAGRNAEALVELERWRQAADEPHPGGLFLLGFAYVQAERFEEGAAVLETIVGAEGLEPRDQWIEVLAYAYARAGRETAALGLLEGLIAKRPERARWWRQLAGLYMLLEDLQAGTASLALSGVFESLSLADARRLARLLAHLGIPDQGATLLSEALAAGPTPVAYEDQMLLGELWLLARESTRAAAAYEAAQPLAPGGEPALMLGRLHASRENFESARAALEDAIRAYGEATPPEVYQLLAITQINLGNLAAAQTAVERLAGFEEFSEQSRRLGAYIRSMQQ
jgi:predicted Zn-dependent protease